MYKPYQLNYSYEALEPYIDAKTMEIHYSKHYQTYLNNLNTVIDKYPILQKDSLEDLLGNLDNINLDEKEKIFFKNNAGGFLNHNIYWQNMDPNNSLDQKLIDEIKSTFSPVEEFKKKLSELGLKHFGSGWAWLVRSGGNLKIYSLPNQDSPYLMGDTPIIGLDVWEHAYYLKYQNRRAEYIENWWKTVKII